MDQYNNLALTKDFLLDALKRLMREGATYYFKLSDDYHYFSIVVSLKNEEYTFRIFLSIFDPYRLILLSTDINLEQAINVFFEDRPSVELFIEIDVINNKYYYTIAAQNTRELNYQNIVKVVDAAVAFKKGEDIIEMIRKF